MFLEEKTKKTCVFKKTTKNLNGKSETRNEPKIAEIRESGICEKLRNSQPGFPEKLRKCIFKVIIDQKFKKHLKSWKIPNTAKNPENVRNPKILKMLEISKHQTSQN